MASAIDKITAFFKKRETEDETTLDATLSKAQSRASTNIAAMFASETKRLNRLRTCQNMYNTDSRIREILSMMGRDVAAGGFFISVNDENAEQLAKDMITETGLLQRVDDYVRLTARDGDSFIEVGVNGDDMISDLSRKHTALMHRNSNAIDHFKDASKAFWWHEMGMLHAEPPADAQWFAEWQMIHLRWDHDEGSRYGSPQFGSAIGPWKKATQGEIDIAVRRKTRAGVKYVHRLAAAAPGGISEYKENNKDVLNNPLSAMADFFLQGDSDVTVLQGDANLSEIADVLHHIETFWVGSPVPMALVAYAQRVNRDVLEEQTAKYHKALEAIELWVENQLIVPLLTRLWLLNGIYPENLIYSVEWSSKKAITAQSLEQIARAITTLAASGTLSTRTLLDLLQRFLPGFDPLIELERLDAEKEDEVDRFAGLLGLPPADDEEEEEGEE